MKKLGAATIVSGVVALVAPYFSLDYNASAEPTLETRRDSIELSLATEPPTAFEPEVTADVSHFSVLIENCPVPPNKSVWSDRKCFEAINRYFSDKATYSISFPGMVSTEGSITYQSILDNQENDRKLVTRALSQRECHLLEGPVRLDLRDRCNAESVTRYTLLATLCYQAEQRRKGVRGRERYYSHLEDSRELALRDIWLESNGLCPTAKFSRPEWTNVRGEQLPPHKVLIEVSARLGDERLLFEDQGCEIWFGGIEYRKSKHKVYEWWDQIHAAIGGIGLVFPTTDKTEAMVSAARGIAGMRNSGFEADMEDIVSRLCSTRYRTEEDCATSFPDAQSLLSGADPKVLDALHEIKEKALALDIYQLP